MFVSAAARKRTWSTRCSASACEDTSIATAFAPAARCAASSACSSIASGVVFASGQRRSPNSPPSVPITPHGNTRRFEHVAHQVRRRRLAVRAGDADDDQVVRGMVVERVGERRRRDARVGDDHERDALRQAQAHGVARSGSACAKLPLGASSSATTTDGAARDRVGDEVVPVRALAAQARRTASPGAPRASRSRSRRPTAGASRRRARPRGSPRGGQSLASTRVLRGAHASGPSARATAAGMMPACSIAARASSAKTGAATCEP